MAIARLFFLTLLALTAFAGNSLLCRIALKEGGIDAASFTSIRLASGALVLWLLTRVLRGARPGGDWPSALALFTYAAAFSFAYLSLGAATGALLLFSAVQATMIGYGLWTGERLAGRQLFGLALALGGLVGLLLPGLSAPSAAGSASMLLAGFAWGVYSLRGRGAADPLQITAGNFLRAVPPAILLSLLLFSRARLNDPAGVMYALVSGALTSALGYAVWYSVLPRLRSTTAATVQLSVPVLTACAGILLLGESLDARFALTSTAILGGIALVILAKTQPQESRPAPRAE